jgi:hypothetical protein
MTTAAHKPTNTDLHIRECSAMADPLSLALRSAYGPKVALSWDLAIMYSTIIGSIGPNRRCRLTKGVHLLFTRAEV